MITINSYEIHLPNVGDGDLMSTIEMPRGASILTTQMKGRGPKVWAIVNTERPATKRRFHWIASGWDVGELEGDWVGTVQDAHAVAWHLFVEPEEHESPGAA